MNLINRNITFDLLRCVSMIWIICIWHLTDYYNDTFFSSIIHRNDISLFTYVCLAAFTFQSGLFVGRGEIHSLGDLLAFYRKRILRIYFLFLISLLTLYLTPHPIAGNAFIPSIRCLIYSAFGLSILATPAPSTLWYVCMLLCFYLITPIFIWLKQNANMYINIVIVLTVLYSIAQNTGGGDARLLYYLPYYIIGVYLGSERCLALLNNKLTYICIILLGFVATMFKIRYIIIFILLILYVKIISFIAHRLRNTHLLAKIIYITSMASYPAYLFHRQLYYLLMEYHIPLIFDGLLIFLMGFVVQVLYNRCLEKILCKKKNVCQ